MKGEIIKMARVLETEYYLSKGCQLYYLELARR
jgi:hypothetical protein